jgi:hypothetical protein
MIVKEKQPETEAEWAAYYAGYRLGCEEMSKELDPSSSVPNCVAIVIWMICAFCLGLISMVILA